jgi:hypothetical protein
LAAKLHDGEENGTCVIALMNMAKAMRFMNNYDKCSELITKCQTIEGIINGKTSDYYKKISTLKAEVDGIIEERRWQRLSWWGKRSTNQKIFMIGGLALAGSYIVSKLQKS